MQKKLFLKKLKLILICSLVLFLMVGCSSDNSNTGIEDGTNTYTVNTEVVSGSGRIEVNPDQDHYQEGTSIEINAIPEKNYVFFEWTGGLSGSENPVEIVIDESLTIGAKFIHEDEITEKPVTEWDELGGSDSVALGPDGYIYFERLRSIEKYSPEGERIWEFEDPYSGSADGINDIGMDDAGNIYYTNSNCDGGENEYYLVKITSQGEELWRFTKYTDAITNIAVNKDGYVYLSSSINIIKKVSPEGKEVWSFDKYPGYYDITLDKDGYIYASVKYMDASKDDKLIKVSPEGDEVKKWEIPRINSIAVSDSYIYYESFPETIGPDEYLYNYVIKLNSEGEEIWRSDSNMGQIHDLEIDNNGNIYVGTGGSDNSLRKFSQDGEELWKYKVKDNTGDFHGVAVDEQGYIYTAEDHYIRKLYTEKNISEE